LRQALIGGHDLVERVGDLAGEPGVIARQPRGEIAVAYRLQRPQQLALIELGIFARGAAVRAADVTPGFLSLHQQTP